MRNKLRREYEKDKIKTRRIFCDEVTGIELDSMIMLR